MELSQEVFSLRGLHLASHRGVRPVQFLPFVTSHRWHDSCGKRQGIFKPFPWPDANQSSTVTWALG